MPPNKYGYFNDDVKLSSRINSYRRARGIEGLSIGEINKNARGKVLRLLNKIFLNNHSITDIYGVVDGICSTINVRSVDIDPRQKIAEDFLIRLGVVDISNLRDILSEGRALDHDPLTSLNNIDSHTTYQNMYSPIADYQGISDFIESQYYNDNTTGLASRYPPYPDRFPSEGIKQESPKPKDEMGKLKAEEIVKNAEIAKLQRKIEDRKKIVAVKDKIKEKDCEIARLQDQLNELDEEIKEEPNTTKRELDLD